MPGRIPQIFGAGGCFFVEPWQEPLLQRHLLSLAGVPVPRICFLGTANGDNPADIEQFYRQMGRHACRPSHLKLFEPHTDRFRAWFLEHDIIYVGGGATRNLMALWEEWGIVAALHDAWQAGVVLAGTSAGSICWFEGCITDSLPARMLPLRCTGFLAGSGCTHYDARPDRPAAFRRYLLEGRIPFPGIATENHTALHYRGRELFEVVTARRGSKAWRLTRRGDAIVEAPLDARLLEGSASA
ncbi:MAG TPA: peptidase E [Woeseiaceae bacterium]|nr:peptidase E [Woeseiaceae bacterium]